MLDMIQGRLGRNMKRWRIVIVGTLLQMCLGTVYAWSYFQKPLVAQFGWSNAAAAWTFGIAICFLGLAAAAGGVLMHYMPPRKLAIIGGLLFGAGYLVASAALSLRNLPLLYAGYGLIGGIGLGLGYVTPVTTVSRWFPDRKGLATGTVIMGFGLGALLMAKGFAPMLMRVFDGDLPTVFLVLGLVFSIATPLFGSLLSCPPEDISPVCACARSEVHMRDVLTIRFGLIWGLFFCNIVAGISIISFQSPLLQGLLARGNSAFSPERLAAAGATMIAASSLFNGLGRILWGALSDRIGRVRTFRVMLASQVVVFALLSMTSIPWAFALLVCYILLCYGGGFGSMPALISDVFGKDRMPFVYGCVLTAWSAAGLIGPQVIARMTDRFGERAGPLSFSVSAGILACGFFMALFARDRAAKLATGKPAQ